MVGARAGAQTPAAHVPRRRCVGCRRVAPKGELLRIVVTADGCGEVRAAIDHTGAMPGRGAYLCRESPGGGPARRCLDLADRRGAIARALRSPAKIDRELVESLSR